ncbi:MAG: peroxiredoxin [Candidatus Nanopelagicales bacterium]
MVEIGSKALDFSLKNQFGETVTLSDFFGKKNVILMFYPFAFTGKCTQELCTIRDERNDFVNEDTQILSISCDPVASLKIFAEEQNLTTPLLSDFWPHGKVCKDYGVFLEDLGFANRGTFVIDKAGIIRWKVVTSPGEVRNTSDYRKALSAL